MRRGGTVPPRASRATVSFLSPIQSADSCTRLSNARESPATTRLGAPRAMNREVRKLHEIAGNVGHEIPLVSESPGCGHMLGAPRGRRLADPGVEEAPLLAKQPYRAALMLLVWTARLPDRNSGARSCAKAAWRPAFRARRASAPPIEMREQRGKQVLSDADVRIRRRVLQSVLVVQHRGVRNPNDRALR
jgi:hypothetical protein